MSTLEYTEVKTRQQMDDFIAVQKRVYENDKNMVLEISDQVRHELDPEQNPIAKQCSLTLFVVYKNNEPVARAACIVNPTLNKETQKKIGQIGYLEFIEDIQVLALLMQACYEYLDLKGSNEIWCDVRFSLNYQVGIQTCGYDEPHTFLMPKQPDYYQHYLNSIGFHCIKKLNAYSLSLTPDYVIPSEIEKQAEFLIQQGYAVRPIKKREIETCLQHYNGHWKGNFAHTPFNEDELKHVVKNMTVYLDRRFCYVVIKNGQLAGYLFTFPDYNQDLVRWKGKQSLINMLTFLYRYKIRRISSGLKTAIIGVDNKHQGKKLSSLLNYALLKAALKYNCPFIERSWILEDNTASIKQARRLGAEFSKQFSIFSISMDEAKASHLQEAS